MPPRKPKQPTRKPAAKQAAGKKGAAKKSSPQKAPDQTEKKIVSGTGVAVGVSQPKTTDHLELEAKMAHAIHQAHSDGLTKPEDIRKRILAARDEHLGDK